MSEPVGLEGGALQPASDAVNSAVQAGQYLRQAREATGLHVAALAVSLKVPVSKLEALEAGRMDLLPDLTFARALAASVCRNLKIDPAPVLEHLPPTGASRLGAEAPAMNTPFRPPGSGPRLSFRSQLRNPAVLAVAALLLGAVAVALWPQAPEPTAVLAPGGEVADGPVAAMPAPDASVPLAEPVSAVPAAPAAVASAPVLAPAVVAASAPVAVSAAAAVLTAKAESWVKVTDAKGVVSLGRILAPGEVVEVAGTLPLAVVVGRVDAVQLQVRGQPFDMLPFAKDHVARFEVK
ncbi:helix-turn-helix domain-containing protein [Rhodoferax sp. OV413]|uniref:helix-turn-helix domain-containing protein n=1 Tax=Rhodoferax sp. OV413 TaxID=1855285 RepID=UPI00159F7A13|nr:helix-turn-helix domain-containing protein [Rhodoferax sp. OV413]